MENQTLVNWHFLFLSFFLTSKSRAYKLFMANDRSRYCGLILRAAHAKITVVGTPNGLNYGAFL